MQNNFVISVDGLTKYYGQAVGIQELTFSVNRSEIFGFLGPNGAGKTTTIRLLLDLLRPTGGKAFVFGEDISSHSLEIRSKCGYLPGNFSAYGHMSGKEFLRFVANLRGSTASTSNLLARFEMSNENLSKKIKHLSHGMRQKLGIVQAFFHQPELLILDEPTNGLDPLMQEEFYALLRETRERGATIFFSSHNLPEVEKVCDRVAIIRAGALVALESLASLKSKRYRKLILTLRYSTDSIHLNQTELLRHEGNQYEFLVKGDIETLLKEIAHLPIEDIVFPEPDLEEVFMTYYQGGEND